MSASIRRTVKTVTRTTETVTREESFPVEYEPDGWPVIDEDEELMPEIDKYGESTHEYD